MQLILNILFALFFTTTCYAATGYVKVIGTEFYVKVNRQQQKFNFLTKVLVYESIFHGKSTNYPILKEKSF